MNARFRSAPPKTQRAKQTPFKRHARNVRTLKAALPEIREADERMQIMLDATPLACSLIDKKHTVLYCNAAVKKLFGIADAQEYTSKFWDFSPEHQPDGQNSRDKALALLKKTFDEGYSHVEWLHIVNNEPVPCEVTLVRVKYKGDDIIAGYTRDMRDM